jgi:hypothetical protein
VFKKTAVKIGFWASVALCVSLTLSPDTIVKLMAVYWIGLLVIVGGMRVLAWWGMRRGTLTVDFPDEAQLDENSWTAPPVPGYRLSSRQRVASRLGIDAADLGERDDK